MTSRKWWHDDDNYRRWEAWNKAARRLRTVKTLKDWLFDMSLRIPDDGRPRRDPDSPPWIRTSPPGVLALERELREDAS